MCEKKKIIIICKLEHIKAKKGFNFSFCSDIFVSEEKAAKCIFIELEVSRQNGR